MLRRFTSLLAALALTMTALIAAGAALSPSSALADKDCGDFNNQKAAQDFFIKAGGPKKDPHNLDSDGDGIACESLPCPCSTSKGGSNGGGSTTPPKTPPVKVQRGKIVRVVDGDTVEVKLSKGGKVDVRLLGIDTPEVYGGKECWGPQASRSAKRMLPKGTRVVLRSDKTQPLKDKYGRLLRYVLKGKTDISAVQVRKGNARVYVVGKKFSKFGKYSKLQKQAKKAHRGLWGAC